MKITFIGCGNMGGAILDGILTSKIVDAKDIKVLVSTQASVERIQNEKNVYTTLDAKCALAASDIVILAIKPYKFEEVLVPIKAYLQDKLLISVAAGVTIERIYELLGNNSLKVVRTMPNTPACVQEALTSLTFNPFVSEEEKDITRNIFNAIISHKNIFTFASCIAISLAKDTTLLTCKKS